MARPTPRDGDAMVSLLRSMRAQIGSLTARLHVPVGKGWRIEEEVPSGDLVAVIPAARRKVILGTPAGAHSPTILAAVREALAELISVDDGNTLRLGLDGGLYLAAAAPDTEWPKVFPSTGPVMMDPDAGSGTGEFSFSDIVVTGVDGDAPSALLVTVDVAYPEGDDPDWVTLHLIAPDGTAYLLRNSDDPDPGEFTVNASTETADGTWRLRAKNYSEDTGTITAWSLTFPEPVGGGGIPGSIYQATVTATYPALTIASDADPDNPYTATGRLAEHATPVGSRVWVVHLADTHLVLGQSYEPPAPSLLNAGFEDDTAANRWNYIHYTGAAPGTASAAAAFPHDTWSAYSKRSGAHGFRMRGTDEPRPERMTNGNVQYDLFSPTPGFACLPGAAYQVSGWARYIDSSPALYGNLTAPTTRQLMMWVRWIQANGTTTVSTSALLGTVTLPATPLVSTGRGEAAGFTDPGMIDYGGPWTQISATVIAPAGAYYGRLLPRLYLAGISNVFHGFKVEADDFAVTLLG